MLHRKLVGSSSCKGILENLLMDFTSVKLLLPTISQMLPSTNVGTDSQYRASPSYECSLNRPFWKMLVREANVNLSSTASPCFSSLLVRILSCPIQGVAALQAVHHLVVSAHIWYIFLFHSGSPTNLQICTCGTLVLQNGRPPSFLTSSTAELSEFTCWDNVLIFH